MLFKDFQGFITVKELNKLGVDIIPNVRGVYVVLFKNKSKPVFLKESVGGHFKERNPTVAIERLESEWVSNEEIIYIGQAGGGSSAATLRKRLKQYLQFGCGKPVGHWGGRFIWQLKDSNELVFAWKETKKDPNVVESEMITKFKEKYSKRPFANLTK